MWFSNLMRKADRTLEAASTLSRRVIPILIVLILIPIALHLWDHLSDNYSLITIGVMD